MPELAVVVPFWQGHEVIEGLVASVPLSLPLYLIVDAESKPPSGEWLSTRPLLRVIQLGRRGYFSGAVNAGIKQACADGAEYILILNQDVILKDGWQDFVYGSLVQYGIAGDGVFGHPAWPNGYVQGTFMAVRRDVIERIGLLNDEDFPLWGATCEYQLRACRAGFSVLPVRDLRCFVHMRGSKKWGKAISLAITQEPEKRPLFLHTPPLVSVVVCCYNYGHYLPDAMASLFAQDWQAFEIIIVDDASTDGSQEIVASYEDAWKGVKIILRSTNGGTAVAFNTGVAAAYGSYITVLSADDWMMPSRLRLMYRAALQYPHNVICDDMIWYKPTGPRVVEMLRVEEPLHELLYRNTMHAGIMYPKKAWIEVGGYPPVMGDGREDWAFNVALARAGWVGKRLAYPLYCYRREGQNRTVRSVLPYEYYLAKMRSLYPDLYAEYDRRNEMGCASCGRRNKTDVLPTQPRSMAQGDPTYVLLEYVGNSYGAMTYWGACTGIPYKAGLSPAYRYVRVAPCDVHTFIESGVFRYVQESQPNSGETAQERAETDQEITTNQEVNGQEAEDKGQEAGGKGQEAGGKRQEAGRKHGRRRVAIDAVAGGTGDV